MDKKRQEVVGDCMNQSCMESGKRRSSVEVAKRERCEVEQWGRSQLTVMASAEVLQNSLPQYRSRNTCYDGPQPSSPGWRVAPHVLSFASLRPDALLSDFHRLMFRLTPPACVSP